MPSDTVSVSSPMMGGGRGGRKRSGRRNTISTAPPPRVANMSTFDWDGQRDRYWRRLDWQAVVLMLPHPDCVAHRLRLAGKPIPKPEKKVYPRKNVQRPGIGKGRRYDREQIVRLYVQERKTVKQIMEVIGCKTDRTVREALRAAGVYDPKRDLVPTPKRTRWAKGTAPGRKPQRICPKGLHEMAKYGKPLMVSGVQRGRYCSACKAIRDPKSPRTRADFEEVQNGSTQA